MTDPSRLICFNLGKVMRRVNNYYQSRLVPYGLTQSQLMVFTTLRVEDGITLSDLSERVAQDASTLTGIVDRMERDGFVQRQPDAEDRRAVRVYLTAKAKEIAPAVEALADDLDAELRGLVSADEMATFMSVLKALSGKGV